MAKLASQPRAQAEQCGSGEDPLASRACPNRVTWREVG